MPAATTLAAARARMQVLRVYTVDIDSACGLGEFHAFKCARARLHTRCSSRRTPRQRYVT